MSRRPLLSLAMLLLAGCQEAVHDRPEVAAGAALMRARWPIPADSVPRGNGALAAIERPPPVTLALLQRGRELFDVYCTPCHGAGGAGDGVVVQRGFPPPPSFHEPAQRELSRARIVAVITEGYGAMAPFGGRIAPLERWAIASYVQALQAASPANALPEEAR